MKRRFFDFEVTPNWWLCVFGDMPDDFSQLKESIKDDFHIVTSDDVNSRDRLLQLLKDEDYVKIGYNIKGYDLVIANAIYQGFTPQQVKVVNDLIIDPSSMWSTKEHMRLSPFAKKKLSSIMYQDLLDDGSGSLKEKEATLGLSILESSVDFNKENLTDEDKADMIFYCKQDVYASMQFYKIVVHPYTETKLNMGKHFNIPVETCYKSTNARLVSIALGAKRQHYADAERIDIVLPDKIRQYCYDNLPLNILERIRTSTEGFTVKLFDNEVSFGNGGVHSTYIGNYNKAPCLYIESDDEYCLVNVDAASYYPSEMIQFNLLSRSVQSPQVFKNIFDERIALKHKENPTPEDDAAQRADKLVLNTTFGASGNKWLDLYDPYMCTSVCRVGQIFLSSLACKIYKTINNAKIIQTNTDGILVYLPRKELPVLDKLQDEWSRLSGINMERDDIVKIWQRDVNNYLMILLKKGKETVKNKGGWLNDNYLRPGYVNTASANAFVCAKAVQQYLLYDKDIVQSIYDNRDLHDFTITCTKGPTYRGVVQRMANGQEVQLFKANRVIASKDKSLGQVFKYKMYKGNISYAKMPSIPENCRLVNEDLSTYDFDEIKKDLDYMFYIERCADLLNIEWVELKHTNFHYTNRFNYFDE
jgi:hypothetical protein